MLTLTTKAPCAKLGKFRDILSVEFGISLLIFHDIRLVSLALENKLVAALVSRIPQIMEE